MPAKVLRVTVDGNAISKSNAAQCRWSRKLKRCEMFIPEKFMEYEDAIRQAAAEYMAKTKKEPFLKGPIEIRIVYFLKDLRKKDLPNLPKTTCDALNDVFYADDCQIVLQHMEKCYDKENPRVVIEVRRPKDWRKKIEDGHWSLPPSYR